MKKPEDFNFKSWVTLYDYLKTQDLKSDSILMCSRLFDDNSMRTYKITMRTVERNAWREIQALRPTWEEVHEVMYNHSKPYTITKTERKLAEFLSLISIYNVSK